MNVNRQLSKAAVLLLLTLLSGLASAQTDIAEEHPVSDEGSSPLLKGAYVAPLASYVISTKAGALDNGFGGSLLVGIRKKFWAMELGGVYDQLSSSGRSASLRGGTVNGLVFPFEKLPDLYGIVGAGGLEVVDYPSVKGTFALTTIAGGAGYLWRWSLGDYDFAIRTEALYRHGHRDVSVNASRTDLDAPHSFENVVFNVGLQLPLSRRPVPAALPPEPVKVVPVIESKDSDGDGVVDGQDQCPDTPAGTKVDAIGCPLQHCKTPAAGERISLAGCGTGDTIVLNGVNFEFNQARLTPNAKTILDVVGAELKANPGIDVELGGHTDSIGKDPYNLRLSQQRAEAVRDYLTQTGVDRSRLTAMGYGASQPVADNETEEGRDRNRRVELKILANNAASGDVGAAQEASPASSSETP